MISQARTLGAPSTVPAREAREQRIERVLFGREAAYHVGDDVHHMAIELDRSYPSR